VFSFLFFWGSKTKNSSDGGKRETRNMENHAKYFMVRDIKFSLKVAEKFPHENSCAALMKKIISPQFFMCENSRRDEKSLNDDWRKLQKTLRVERERRLFSVVSYGRARGSSEKGVKIATHTHTHVGEREDFSSRSLMRE
jgi:hypothetical protein